MGCRDIRSKAPDLGAVMTAVISPTRIVLVKQLERAGASWKLSGGSVEKADPGMGEQQVVAAAVRETEEETGIALEPSEVRFCFEHDRTTEEYYPYFCLAEVSEEKMDTRAAITYDDYGRPVEVQAFTHKEAWAMPNLLARHRVLLDKLTTAMA